MFLSPPEIKQQQLREKKGAYERQDVDALLDNVVGSYQHVWLERDRLQARVEELEREMANTKELERLLRDGLASAQRAAEQVKEEARAQVSGLVDDARSKAEALLAEARAKADEIVSASRETRNRLEAETSRLQQANRDVRDRYKAFLLEALSVVQGTAEHRAVTAEDAAVAEAEPEPAGWLATVPLVATNAESFAEEATSEPESPAAEEEEPAATVLLSAVPEPEAEPPEPEASPEPEPEPEPPAPEEAYMTFRGLSAVAAEEEQSEAPPPAPADEDPGEDAYEDWSPKKP